MARIPDKRRPSTIVRADHVHDVYREVMDELGGIGHAVAKSYIYERIRERTGLCAKTIAYILNHTEKSV